MLPEYGEIYFFNLTRRGIVYWYVGKTRQSIMTRYAKHVSDLKLSVHPNPKLQFLYDTLLEETGEIPILDFVGCQRGRYTDKELEELEERYISDLLKQHNEQVLNIRIGAKLQESDKYLRKGLSQSLWDDPEYAKKTRDGIRRKAKSKGNFEMCSNRSKKIWDDKDNRKKNQLSQPHSRPVEINGVIYHSIKEAVRLSGVPKYKIQQIANAQQGFKPTPTNVPRQITLEGIEYPSVAEAARRLGLCTATIHQRLKKQESLN